MFAHGRRDSGVSVRPGGVRGGSFGTRDGERAVSQAFAPDERKKGSVAAGQDNWRTFQQRVRGTAHKRS